MKKTLFIMSLIMILIFSSCSVKKEENSNLQNQDYSSSIDIGDVDIDIPENSDYNNEDYNMNPNVTEPDIQNVFAEKLEPDYTNFLNPVYPVAEVPEGYIGIYSPEELDSIRYNLKGNYILMRDLDMSEFGTFYAINNLSGVFDGNGHKISGLNSIGITWIHQPVGPNICSVGLFGSASEVKNLGIENINLDISDLDEIEASDGILKNVNEVHLRVSAIAAYAKKISNCYVTGSISISDVNYPIANLTVGAVAGRSLNASECYSNCAVSINGVDYDNLLVGGISGQAGEITKCCVENTITADCAVKEFDSNYININNGASVSAGGITGHNDGKVSECWNSATVFVQQADKLKDISCGGISGFSDHTIEKCYNTGGIQANASAEDLNSCYIGGIVGSVYPRVSNGTHCVKESYNKGFIVASGIPDVYAGGIIGYSCGEETIYNCFNIGGIQANSETGTAYCGGICGYNGNKVQYCYNGGAVSPDGVENMAGAICGGFSSGSATVEKCYYINIGTYNLPAVGTRAMFSDVKQLSEEEMSDASNFKDFDFGTDTESGVWGYNMSVEYNYPVLVNVYFMP